MIQYSNMNFEQSNVDAPHSCECVNSQKKNWTEFKVAIPIAVLFVLIFIALQKMGLVNLINSEKMGVGTIFVIGFVASLSSCMAVVGALVLSMSATFAHTGASWRTQTFFHLGRIISFFLLGGLIGAIGSAFTLSSTATLTLNVLVALVLLILGINLLEVFPWAKKLQPSMPKFFKVRIHNFSKIKNVFGPVIFGVATFFLPCGFTQSMQIFALSTGNFLEGAVTMLVFALGTLPVLLVVSFGSFSFKNSKNVSVFFKVAGMIVILFALFNFLNALVVSGIISPIFNF